jgi:hypothetical protein
MKKKVKIALRLLKKASEQTRNIVSGVIFAYPPPEMPKFLI